MPRPEPGLWCTDEQIIQAFGIDARIARANIADLERRHSDFPKKQKAWGDRRWWPAVVAFFEHHYGFKVRPAAARREKWIDDRMSLMRQA